MVKKQQDKMKGQREKCEVRKDCREAENIRTELRLPLQVVKSRVSLWKWN